MSEIRLEASHRAYEVAEGGREDKCPLCGIKRENAGWIPETCGKHIHEPGCFVLPRAAGEGERASARARLAAFDHPTHAEHDRMQRGGNYAPSEDAHARTERGSYYARDTLAGSDDE